MVGVPPARDDEENRLTGARGEFVASLPRRLELLRAALAALAEAPAERERLNGLLRRLHALASAARVLGFASVAEVLAEAERTLRKSSKAGPQGVALKEVARAFDMLPSLVTGAAVLPRSGPEAEALAGRSAPVSILVFGPPSLADAFRAEVGERFELEHSDDAARATDLARSAGPDAVIIDAEMRGSREFVEQLRQDPLVEPPAVVVVGNFAGPDAAAVYVAAGADRVLPKPVSPETLRRTLLELGELSARQRGALEPVGELTVDELAERIAGEVKKGLVDSLELGGHSTRVNFGDGADVLGAVWGAVARVRELVTLRSSGNLRFQPFGPEGAIPLAPWMNDERRAGDRGVRHGRAVDDVALKFRRIVVADDDPAVVWFLSGLLKAVGAQVIEAHDGERALERVFEAWPDLVVSDVLMPRRDGFSLCHEIKRDVLVRDVPVILLSWKEDLLQRVRELGAAADGYLRKEAAASTVVERVREVLRPRARIEQRLKVGGEVRGRLDGVTPRLVLELVSQFCPDATLTIRDAVYLYEAQLRAGRLRSLTRSAADGSFERGPAVLGALLGVSAGRFVVQPDSTPCRAEFDAALPELFEPAVRRARAALRALSAERLPRVLRVELDLAPVARYLECTPENARRLIERLAAGEAPRDLLMNGEASAWLMEAVLSDMARRGAVLAVEREPGSELAEPALAAAAPPAGDFGSVDSAWSESVPPPAGAAPSNMRASAAAVSDAEAVQGSALLASGSVTATASVTAPIQQAQSVPLERETREAPSATAASGDEGWFSFQLDPTASRDVPPVAPVPSSEEADSVFAALAEETADEPMARAAPPRRDLTPAGLGPPGPAPSTAEPRSETPARVGVRPVLRMPPPSADKASLSMADVFAAALEEAPDPNAEVTVRTLVPPPTSAPTDPVPPGPELAASAKTSIEAPPPDEPERDPLAVTQVSAPPDPLAQTLVSAAPPKEEDEPSVAPPTSDEAEKVEPPRAESGAVKEALPDPSESLPVVSIALSSAVPAPAAANLGSAAPGATLVSGTSLVEPVAVKDEPLSSGSLPVATPLPPTEPPPEAPPAQALKSVEALVAKTPTPAKSPAPKPATKSPDVTPAPTHGAIASTLRSAEPAPPEPTPEPKAEPAATSGDGLGRTIALALAAFGATFLLFRYALVPALAPAEAPEPTPGPSAIVAAVRGSATPAPAGPVMNVQDLALPEGFDPGAGRGLLEIATAPADSIYVDGTFVGRGPGRSVPVAGGRHEVKIVRADAEHTTFVELKAGRRLRVGLELDAGGAPRP
jgi:CheY-like chemotaxis protein/HPt (histidine-containing phosphotransfer) domain-containing protein